MAATFDESARRTGWLVLSSGEAYSQQISWRTELFLLLTEYGWTVWYGNWNKGEPEPYSAKTLESGLSFADALKRANDYISWRTGKKVRK